MTSQKQTNNSSQCKAIFKAEAVASKMSHNFACSDFNNYTCERRSFSPDVEPMTHFLRECLGSGDICVDVEVAQFNTSAARKYEPAEQFLPGGEYNRDEFRCHHKFMYQNQAVFEGQGDSIEQALSGAMHECERSVEGL